MGQTLKELGVNVGDRVSCHGYEVTVTEFREGGSVVEFSDGLQRYFDGSSEWSLVSRATPPIDLTAITTPLGLLDEATQKALKDDGGPYEFYNGDRWFERDPLWYRTGTYRKKPAPKVETVVLYWNHTDGVRVNRLDPGDTHRIILTLTDGVTDPVAKVEAIK